MTSPFCAEQSSVDAKGLAKSIGSAAGFTYGTCDVWCELALSFRSLATLAVYILPRERRRELLAVRATWRRFGERAHGWVLLGWSRDEVHEAQVIRLDSLATSQVGVRVCPFVFRFIAPLVNSNLRVNSALTRLANCCQAAVSRES